MVVSVKEMAQSLQAGCCCASCLICLKITAGKVVMETRRVSVLWGGSARVSACI